jgi:hypothetical protein
MNISFHQLKPIHCHATHPLNRHPSIQHHNKQPTGTGTRDGELDERKDHKICILIGVIACDYPFRDGSW